MLGRVDALGVAHRLDQLIQGALHHLLGVDPPEPGEVVDSGNQVVEVSLAAGEAGFKKKPATTHASWLRSARSS